MQKNFAQRTNERKRMSHSDMSYPSIFAYCFTYSYEIIVCNFYLNGIFNDLLLFADTKCHG